MPEDFAERIAYARHENGYSLREVQRLTGDEVKSSYLSQLETGQIKSPSARMLLLLGQVYGLDHAELLRLVGLDSGR